MALIELNLEKPAFKRTELSESEHRSGGRSSTSRGGSDDEDFEEIDFEDSGGRSRASRMMMVVMLLAIAMIGVFAARKLRGGPSE